MSWKHLCTLALAGAVFLSPRPLFAADAENPYSTAEFSFSSDPTKMVLHVRYAGGLVGSFQSMSLFGDGRLVLKRGRKATVLEEFTQSLSFTEVESLLRLAVDHALAEWDGTAFLAKSLEVNDGRPLTTPTDALRATILLSIEDYSRGDYRVDHIRQRISFTAPKFVDRHYPKIREVTGIALLVDELLNRLARAKENTP